MRRIPRLDFSLQLRDFRRDGNGQFQDRLLSRRGVFLRQMADADVFLEMDRSRVRRINIQDERKQSGFARAIGADQPEAVFAIDLQRDIFEQRPRAE